MRTKQTVQAMAAVWLFQTVSLFGQIQDTTNSPQGRDAFKRWSLNFHMDEDFNWDLSRGSLISGQVFFTPDLALRLGVGGEYSQNIVEREQVVLNHKLTDKRISLDLYPTLLFYHRTAPFKFYWGLGLVVGILEEEYKDEQRLRSSDEWQTMSKMETTGYNLGLQGVLGAAWRFQSHFFLFLEYNPRLVYRYQENDNMRSGETQIKTFRLYSNPVGLGVGILL